MIHDDIVSLTALMRIVNPQPGNVPIDCYVTQLTLSLYLMTQCQLKLHYSLISLAQTRDYIKVAQRRHPAGIILDQLALKLICRKVVAHARTFTA